MATHKLINFFTKQEVLEILKTVDSIEDKWIKRQVSPTNFYYTLGNESFVDCVEGVINESVIKEINKNNLMLKENLHFMYTSVISKISEMFGKCELATDIPIPGFFIYTERDGVQKRNNGIPNIHQDGKFEYLNYYWDTFKKVEHDSTFGFTVALQLPASGAGMCVWDEPDQGFYSNSEWANEVKRSNFYLNPNSGNILDTYIVNKIPNVIEYSVGKALVQQGAQYHSVAHGINLTQSDRRITLQGFGKKCDGIWRLYL